MLCLILAFSDYIFKSLELYTNNKTYQIQGLILSFQYSFAQADCADR